MTVVAFIALAAAGTVGRWQASRLNTSSWATGTFMVNVTAAFVAGAVHARSTTTVTLLAVAMLGSVSTFSTVVREVVDTAESPGGAARAAVYASCTLAAGIAAAWLGLRLA